jgi:protein TonB
MTALSGFAGGAFKRALYISGAAHALLLLVIIINPSLPSSRKTGVLAYINLGSFSGGGGSGGMRGPGGGGGTETVVETPLPQKTLRDLTTLQKLQAQNQSSLRYPVEKSKRDRSKPAPDKVASVARSDPKAKSDKTDGRAASGAGGQNVGGAGLRIGGYGPGAGDGPGGGGGGGQLGIDNFPYAYYLQNIQDRISARWFQSLVDPGVSGTFQATVYFRIFRDGSISEVEIKESSGLPSLDLSAKRAIITAAPFPPLPADYDEPYLGIRLIFEHSK